MWPANQRPEGKKGRKTAEWQMEAVRNEEEKWTEVPKHERM